MYTINVIIQLLSLNNSLESIRNSAAIIRNKKNLEVIFNFNRTISKPIVRSDLNPNFIIFYLARLYREQQVSLTTSRAQKKKKKKKATMAEKHYLHFSGYAEVVPESSAGSKRMVNESNEVERSSRTEYKDKYSGCSNHYSTQHKTEEFVDKRSGRLGFKEEVKFTSTHKVVDKVQDYTTEYQTQVKVKKTDYPKVQQVKFKKTDYPKVQQVKFKKTVYPNKTTSKSNNSKINYY